MKILLILLDSICRDFRVGDQTVHALKDICLEIDKGEYVSVMGPSGAGKSTLLNIIALLDHPSAGRYELDGKDVTELSDHELARERRVHIGFVFQFFHLIPRLTAAENIELPMILAGISPDERKVRVAAAIEAFGLIDRADHRPNQLSGGERQRAAIARATIMRPGVLLADEPTGNLDRTSGREVINLLEDLNRKGVTLLLVTHDPELGMRAGRRIKMVDGGLAYDSHAGE
jgi:ABC-type antimicrobial peptide transport system, ATPase component